MKDLLKMYDEYVEDLKELKKLNKRNEELNTEISDAVDCLCSDAYDFYDVCCGDFGQNYDMSDMISEYVDANYDLTDIDMIDEYGLTDELNDAIEWQTNKNMNLWDAIKQAQFYNKYYELDSDMSDIVYLITNEDKEEEQKIINKLSEIGRDFWYNNGDFLKEEYGNMTDEEIYDNIGDLECEFCDEYVDFYNDDLWAWLIEHIDEVEGTLEEYGYKISFDEIISEILMTYYENTIYQTELDDIDDMIEEYNGNRKQIEFLEGEIDKLKEEIRTERNIVDEQYAGTYEIDEYTYECMEYYVR